MPPIVPPEQSTEKELQSLLETTPYLVERRLGGGGMGEVFLVRNERIDRLFVLKVLHKRYAEAPQLIERMRLEARALAKLRHPHIVAIADFRTLSDGRPFIVMEYLAGLTLADELFEVKVLSVPDAIEFGRQALSALAAAHAIGIVHRDIKLENLFLSEQQDSPRMLKVLDFGIVRVMPGVSPSSPPPLSLPTDTGLVMGTPRYVSPEGATGKKVDHRADIYAMGIVLYELVCGRGPFDHIRLDGQVLAAHVNQQPAPPSQFAKQPIPTELDQAILKALRKNPDERFADAEEFERVLGQIADGIAGPGGSLATGMVNRGAIEAAGMAQATEEFDPRFLVPPNAPARLDEREGEAMATFANPRRRSAPKLVFVLVGAMVTVLTTILVALLVQKLRGGGP